MSKMVIILLTHTLISSKFRKKKNNKRAKAFCVTSLFINVKYLSLCQITFPRWPIRNGSLNGSTDKSWKKWGGKESIRRESQMRLKKQGNKRTAQKQWHIYLLNNSDCGLWRPSLVSCRWWMKSACWYQTENHDLLLKKVCIYIVFL